MINIGNVKIESKLALAPMAGVTDLAFRSVCRQLGTILAFTEMVSAKALMYQDRKTRELLLRNEEDSPLAAQIFGSEPSIMGEAAVKAHEISGCELIDINMGCPTGKIVKNGDGAALMRDLDLAGRIIEAVVRASKVPVTVKMRKGWDKGSVCAAELAKIAKQAGAAAVTVHGRTKTQMYSGHADWEAIAAVKSEAGIPVIANGDIFEPQDAVRLLKLTKADMLMIGRGAMGNPWIFPRTATLLNGEEDPGLPPLPQRCDIAMRQFELAAHYKGERVACLEARKHYMWYLRGVPYAGYFKSKIAQVSSMDALRVITDGIKRELTSV